MCMRHLALAAVFAIYTGVAVAAPSAAQLQSISGMVSELNAAKAEEAGQAATIGNVESEEAPKTKELKVYNDQVPTLKAAYAGLNAELKVHNEDARKQQAATAVHNGNCAGKTLPRPAYERCQGETTQINNWGARVNQSKASLDAKTANLDKKRDSIVNRAKTLESQIQALENHKQEAQRNLERARVRISALTARLQAMCTSVPTSASMEEIKLKCGNVDFDGANRNLPPCETDRCKEYDRMTR